MIRNIIFDIGNVIWEKTPKIFLKDIDIEEETKEIIEKNIFDNPLWINLDKGIYDLNSYFEVIRDTLPVDTQDIAKKILTELYKNRNFNKEIIELIKELDEKYNIYILSDNNMDYYEYLKTTELDDYIDGWCVSAIYNEMKKDTKLFKILFNKYKLKPEECYFIDDKKENIEIGKSFGMNGFVLDWEENKFNDLINDMRINNIEI